jgi:hypothetical protein
VQRSEEDEVTEGVIAEGGGEITIVRELASLSTFEFDVESVITLLVVCEKAAPLIKSEATVSVILILFN